MTGLWVLLGALALMTLAGFTGWALATGLIGGQAEIPDEPEPHPFFARCPHGVQFLSECDDCPGGWQPRATQGGGSRG